MVSQVHRFLSDRTLFTAEPVWHLTGNTDDIFFHDAYLGCLSLTDTIRHWTLEQDLEALAVVLTTEGELIPGADTLTSLLHARCKQPTRRNHILANTSNDAIVSSPSDQAARRSAVEDTHTHAGSQEYADRLALLSAVFTQFRSSIVAVVFGLPEQFERAASEGEIFELQKMVRALVRHAQESTRSLLVLVDPRAELSPRLLRSCSTVTINIPTPSREEIEVALARVSLRHSITMRHDAKSIASYLATSGNLQDALRRIASITKYARIIGVDTLLRLPEPDESRVASIFQELDSLVGLENIKSHFHGLPDIARQRRIELRERGKLPETTMHMVFKGSAGTGKTSVARIVAQLFHALGILPKDEIVEILPTVLISKHANEAAEQMRADLVRGRGGVIFIDEAHQLMGNPHSEESIKTLVTFAENHRNDTVIILAGYTDRIDALMRIDEGLKRRFPTNLIFHDYNTAELCQVVHDMARADGFTMNADTRTPLMQLLEDRRLDANFGNAGGARNTWQQIRDIHYSRPNAVPNVIETADIPATITVDSTQAARASSPETAPPTPLGAMIDSDYIKLLQNAILPIVVAREDYQDMGTGFLIAASGLVATAAHVIQDAVRVTIGLEDVEAKIIAVDEKTDTALLHLPAEAVSGYEPLPLGQSWDVCAPSELLAVGYQNWKPGEDPFIVRVHVSRNMRDKPKFFEVGGGLDRGTSGGPLIDPSQGAVIGLVSGGAGSTTKMIARIEQLRRLLEKQGHGNKHQEHGRAGIDPEQGV